MKTKTMIKILKEKGYTMEDIQGNFKEHEGCMTYPEWLSMMKEIAPQIPAKSW